MKGIRVTVDIVILALREDRLNALLVRRGIPPYQGRWAVPGGFVEENESLEQAALRELREETGVTDVYLEQLYSFGDPKRDPRGRIVTIAYFALLARDAVPVRGGSDAREAKWMPIDELPNLAFDHGEIMRYALERLRYKIEYTTVGFQLLPKRFTLTELQRTYEAILGRKMDKRNFRRKMALLKILIPLKEWKRSGIQRPARLYRFSPKKFEKLREKGILFPF